jgi:transcriptional regulator with XRE-family HTH domain
MSEVEQVPAEETARWRDFGVWLARTRVDLEYTQAYVANRAGISTQNLVSLEHGGFRRRAGGPWNLPNPADDTLKALARIYRVDAAEMFKRVGRYDDRPQTKSGLRHRGRASSRQAERSSRLDELEERDRQREREHQEMKKRLEALERRFPKQPAVESPAGRRSRRASG